MTYNGQYAIKLNQTKPNQTKILWNVKIDFQQEENIFLFSL